MSNPLNSLLTTQHPKTGHGTTNRGRYSNPALDKLVDQASATMDEKARSELLQKAGAIAMADYALLPLHFELSVWAMKRNLRYDGRVDQATLAQGVTSQP